MKKYSIIILFLIYTLFSINIHAEIIEEVLTDLEEYAIQLMEEENVPGMAYAIVHEDEIIYSNAFGIKSIDNDDPVDVYTMFEIGSTTKAFTSLAMAILVDRDYLKWKDRVIMYYPEFVMYDKWVQSEFLIEDLFSQRSGLQPYSLDLMTFLGFSRHQVRKAIGLLEPVASFRHSFGYVNNLFLIGAKVIENISGDTWEDFLEQEIFNPLQMHNTSAKPDNINAYTNRANGHMIIDDEGTQWSIPHDWIYNRWLFEISPAGGIYSNVMEMSNWVRLHLNNGTFNNNEIISPKAILYTHNPKVFADFANNLHPVNYCLAWVYRSNTPFSVSWHNGQTFGMHSIVYLIPEANLGIVVLTNNSSNNIPALLANRLYQLFFPDSIPPKIKMTSLTTGINSHIELSICEKKKPDKEAFQLLTGMYRNPAYGYATVYEDDEILYMSIGAINNEIIAPLYHYQNDIYVMPIPEFPNMYFLVEFTMESQGQATELRVDACSDVNQGIFRRKF